MWLKTKQVVVCLFTLLICVYVERTQSASTFTLAFQPNIPHDIHIFGLCQPLIITTYAVTIQCGTICHTHTHTYIYILALECYNLLSEITTE